MAKTRSDSVGGVMKLSPVKFAALFDGLGWTKQAD
jgi:hypothetical protein